jgi:hypothetical protein
VLRESPCLSVARSLGSLSSFCVYVRLFVCLSHFLRCPLLIEISACLSLSPCACVFVSVRVTPTSLYASVGALRMSLCVSLTRVCVSLCVSLCGRLSVCVCCLLSRDLCRQHCKLLHLFTIYIYWSDYLHSLTALVLASNGSALSRIVSFPSRLPLLRGYF